MKLRFLNTTWRTDMADKDSSLARCVGKKKQL